MGLSQLYKEKVKQIELEKKCVVGQWRESLSEEDQTAFDFSIDDTRISNRTLSKLYHDSGAPFQITALQTHRTGGCACHR